MVTYGCDALLKQYRYNRVWSDGELLYDGSL